MDKRRVNYLILRTLSGSIDIIIILVPLFFIGLYIFEFSFKVSELYAQAGFLIYNILMIDWRHGQTLGKKIARLYVVFEEGEQVPLIKKGMREVAKLLYFLPIIGIFFCIISICLYLVKKKFIHDMVGRSRVMLEKDYLMEVDISE